MKNEFCCIKSRKGAKKDDKILFADKINRYKLGYVIKNM